MPGPDLCCFFWNSAVFLSKCITAFNTQVTPVCITERFQAGYDCIELPVFFYDDVNIKNRFGCKTRNGSASNMLYIFNKCSQLFLINCF